jgi:DNA-binding NtrC family response regulator
MNKAVTAISNQSVLVVEDDARVLRSLEKVLQDEALDVIPAFGAREALEILARRQRKVDLVITDNLGMPFLNGMTLVYAIHEVYPALPVVVLTALGSTDVRAECLHMGAAVFLEKPLGAEHLLKTVRQALSKDTGADMAGANKIDAEGQPGNGNSGKSSNQETS